MAYHSLNGTAYIKRTTALLPAASGDATVSFWFKPTASTPSGTYRTYYVLLDDPGTYLDYVFIGSSTNTDDVFLEVAVGGVAATSTKTAVTLDKWYYATWTKTGTTHRFYLNGTLISTLTKNIAASVYTFESMGDDGTSTWGQSSLAYMREWTAQLTAAQIIDEMQSVTAVLNTGSYMDCPFEADLLDISGADLLDISGFGHDWTTVGAVSYLAQPTFPSNNSIATATAFGTLPQAITQDFGDGLYAWYSYTGHADEVIAGFFAYAAIPTDSMVTTVYESDGTTAFLDITGTNVPLQVPQSSGTLLYFKVEKAGSPPSTSVTFSGVPGPTSAVPAGSIFTNDDVSGFRMMAISATGSDYSPLRYFVMPATVSENGGDVLTDGSFLLVNDDDSTLGLYSGQLALQSTVAGVTTTGGTVVRTCLTPQVWYVGNPGAGAVHSPIRRVNASGVVTDTWTLTAAGLTGLAATNDETTIYVTGQSSSINAPIKQWNPATSAFGANLVAGVANYVTSSLLVTGDDSVLAIYGRDATHDVYVRRYNAAGALQNTYQPWGANTVLHAGVTDFSLFHATDDPVSFWIRLHDVTGVDTAASVYYNIKVSDGSVLETRIQGDYEGGIFGGTATATPTSRFGIASSCPSFILREAIAAPTPSTGDPVEYLIRRERIFPVISKEQHRLFFSKLQLYFEAGVGLSTGQGSDPIVELDWSDDGGHTWSNLHLIQTGKQGQFTRRAMKWNMGSARERLYRVAVTDPVQWTLIDAFLEITEGVS